MKEVFNIGIVKGVFDIFIPGAFLLLHVAAACVFLCVDDPLSVEAPDWSFLESAVAATAFVCFSYLLGILMRLIKTRPADRLSAFLMRKYGCKRWGLKRVHAKEAFPYFAYLRGITRGRLPGGAHEFYRVYWYPFASFRGNRHIFNYYKTILSSLDPPSAREAASAEALSRYAASMFYALAFSSALVLAVGYARDSWIPYILVFTYGVFMIWILFNLRLLRFKEVEALFVATYKNMKDEKHPPQLPQRPPALGGRSNCLCVRLFRAICG